MPIEALGFFMESNFVKHRKGEFNGKRDFLPSLEFSPTSQAKATSEVLWTRFLPSLEFSPTSQA
jgi:hypothetical protein